MMTNNILESVKSLCGSDTNYAVFNQDFMALINSCFATLNQLGAGPAETFVIEEGTETWDQFSQDKFVVSMAKQYIYLTIRISWDTPSAGFVLESAKELRKEIESRLIYHCSTH